MAMFGSNMVEDVITACTEKSEKQLKAERAKLQEQAEQAHAAWKAFVEKTDKKVQERHLNLADKSDRLDRYMKTFPVELPQLASFDINNCFLGDLGKELKSLEDRLLDLESKLSSMGRVAIESRQELYEKLINVGALWRLGEGKSEEAIIREFQDYRSGLKNAGGPVNPGLYGPRVKKVFDGLKM
jgi:hypothetical protein